MNELAVVGLPEAPQIEKYFRWAEQDGGITICLRLETKNRLQLDAIRAADSFSNGFACGRKEVGGILLGRTEWNEGRVVVYVHDIAPVPCDHSNGPFYDLSARDAGHLETALARDRGIENRSVVGYYRSHNRGGLFLSADDLRLIRCYFQAPDNLFMVVKSRPEGECTAGFFAWKHGRIQAITGGEVALNPASVGTPILETRRELLSLSAAAGASVAPAERRLVSVPEKPLAVAVREPARVVERMEKRPVESKRAEPKRVESKRAEPHGGLDDSGLEHDGLEKWIGPRLVTGVAAALLFGVVVYRQVVPRAVHGRDGTFVPVAMAPRAQVVPAPIRQITPARRVDAAAALPKLSSAQTKLPDTAASPNKVAAVKPDTPVAASKSLPDAPPVNAPDASKGEVAPSSPVAPPAVPENVGPPAVNPQVPIQ